MLRRSSRAGDDKVLPAIVWQNLHPLLEEGSNDLIVLVEKMDPKDARNLSALLPRVIDRMLGSKKPDPDGICRLIAFLSEAGDGHPQCCCQCLAALSSKVQTGEVTGPQQAVFKEKLRPVLSKVLAGKPDGPLYLDAALLAAALQESAGIEAARKLLSTKERPEAIRLRRLAPWWRHRDPSLLDLVVAQLADSRAGSVPFRGQVIAALANFNHPRVGEMVLSEYPKMEPDLQPKAIELLTQRVVWAKPLLTEIARKKIAANALNVNQVKKLLALKDKELTKQVTAVWGSLREDRSPEREKWSARCAIFSGRRRAIPGGMAVFKNLCGQCHKMHGEGQEVGPDITANGRSDFDQLLSNVFDPSLVIGAGYLATTVATKKGQVITGLVVEDNAQRVVLKLQGGKLETIARGDIDEMAASKVSLMPEGLEKQLKPQEIADLFAFLCLDKPPSDPAAKRIPGSPSFRK